MAARLDLKSIAAALGAKRTAMAEPAAAERATGDVHGGLRPLGQRRRLAFTINESAHEFERIHVSGGRRGLEIGIAPGDFVSLMGAVVTPIVR